MAKHVTCDVCERELVPYSQIGMAANTANQIRIDHLHYDICKACAEEITSKFKGKGEPIPLQPGQDFLTRPRLQGEGGLVQRSAEHGCGD